jgi:hypothetical protein
MKRLIAASIGYVVLGGVLLGAQHVMPPGMSHDEHLKQLKKDEELKRRGAVAMGFDQDATTHHFLLARDGGSIVVTANSTADGASIDSIRLHLREIANDFAKGDFAKPFATHAEVPPGVAAMTARRASIQYRYEDRDAGAAVVLTTTDRTTLKAIHQFLRYQIAEHKTGDPLKVPEP